MKHSPAGQIFIVDDDVETLAFHCIVLERAGWSVHAFPSAHLCLDVLRHRMPDCIVSDLEMPGMDGAEFEFTLKSLDIAVPMVAVTASSGSSLARQARAVGVHRVLQKPAAGLVEAVLGAVTDDAYCVPRVVLTNPEQSSAADEGQPGMNLFLAPDLTIIGASAAYRYSTLTLDRDIVGRPLFEVFPDNPANPQADGVARLRASLGRVLETAVPDAMPLQRYDMCDRDAGNTFVERWWSAVNCPVLSPSGVVRFIVHSVADATRAVLRQREFAAAHWKRLPSACLT